MLGDSPAAPVSASFACEHYSRNERTSEEGEEERGLRRGERGEGDGAKRAGDEGARERAEEEDEEEGAGGERRAVQARGEHAEADPPQEHPEDVRHAADDERQRDRGRAEAPRLEERTSAKLERERGGLVAKPQSYQRSRRRRPSEEADGKPGSKSVGQHMRNKSGGHPSLKGYVAREGCRRLPTRRIRIMTEAVLIPKTPMEASTSAQQATVLVVEDRREVLDVLQRTLADNGYRVITAMDGDAGLRLALDEQPSLIILDIGLPKRSGLSVAQELRARAFTAPVLMLTARDTVNDKVQGFEAGADDYLSKPFDYDELLARVRALLRRSAMVNEETLLRVADLTINPLTRDVVRGDRSISLTQKEYALLEYLVRHAGMPVTRDQISEHVWKQDFDPTTNIVDVYINYLRKKIDLDADKALVQTVRGVGYILKGD